MGTPINLNKKEMSASGKVKGGLVMKSIFIYLCIYV